jgi:hypothetical protein
MSWTLIQLSQWSSKSAYNNIFKFYSSPNSIVN